MVVMYKVVNIRASKDDNPAPYTATLAIEGGKESSWLPASFEVYTDAHPRLGEKYTLTFEKLK